MTLLAGDMTVSLHKLKDLFPLSLGEAVIAGGKRPGQTAAMARYSIMAGKDGRDHIIELGYGTVPDRKRAPKDYPLLLPKLDSELGRFNIDGNTNNVLILKFRERKDRMLVLDRLRNFNAPCEIETGPGRPTEKLALAAMEVAQFRVREILNGKINVEQDPAVFISLIHHAIEMRAGHLLRQNVG